MNENITKVASSIVGAFRTQPLALAMVLINFALVGLIYFILVRVAEQRASDVANIFKNQAEMMRLMSQCDHGSK